MGVPSRMSVAALGVVLNRVLNDEIKIVLSIYVQAYIINCLPSIVHTGAHTRLVPRLLLLVVVVVASGVKPLLLLATMFPSLRGVEVRQGEGEEGGK